MPFNTVCDIIDNSKNRSDEYCANVIYGAYTSSLISKNQMLILCAKYGIVSVLSFWNKEVNIEDLSKNDVIYVNPDDYMD